MALSFQRSLTKKRSQVVAVDMGSRTTKAVQVKRHGHGFELTGFCIQDTAPFEKPPTADSISKILKELLPRFESKPKSVVLIIGSTDSLLRPVELPTVPVADMRLMLRYNSKNYLQQDLSDHVFDCHILPNLPGAEKPEAGKPPKSRTLVGGAKKGLIDACQEGAKIAGVQLEQIVPNLVGNANAFELAQPELFAQGSVALVDIGFKSSSICILNNTELGLNRVVGIGGDHLTRGLMEAMSISYEEAEKLKCESSEEVQPFLSMLLAPLGRELRASIDFFEKQEDKTISEVFLSGGSALQPFIIENLQSELMVACKTWNPTSFLTLGLPPQQLGEIERIAPLLAVATGVAVAAF